MEFAWSNEGIFVNQRKYILHLHGEIGLLGCKATKALIEPNLTLKYTKPKDLVNMEKYRRLVGRLSYFSYTRPNIAFVVSMVSQFMHSIILEHFDAIY